MSEAEITARNADLDALQRQAKLNRWRFLCRLLPHRWKFTHLFDDEPNYPDFRGASNYAGICLRCGKRDLFRGLLRAKGGEHERQRRHYLGATKRHLEQLYGEHPHDPALREQISDVVDWIDAKMAKPVEARRTVRSVRLAHINKVGFDAWRGRNLWVGRQVMIYSGEHGAWWRPNAEGYTDVRTQAWVVDFGEAYEATKTCGPEKRIKFQALASAS
jgi:hypothetical protein